MGFGILFREIIGLFDAYLVLIILASTSLGIIIGALPGLTATMGVALLTGLTFGLPTVYAIPILMSIYVGAIYGGSISAVLINIPGTGASAATALDGFPLAQRGEGVRALYLTRIASFIGTIIGLFCLLEFAPLLATIGERYFASHEYFLLAVFGVVICGSLTALDKPIKGWIAGFIGLMMSFVGIEEIFGYPRYTFGNPNLLSGISFIPAMIGIFGIPQILNTLKNKNPVFANVASVSKKTVTEKRIPLLTILRKNILNIVRSGLIGVGIGTIPGAGEDIASWLSYDRAKKGSKHPEEFGKGSYEGIIASETGNNACIGGAIIPLLSLGVPGSPPAAVLLGALYLHGVRPGPMLAFENPTFSYTMTAILLYCAVALLLCGFFLSSIMAKVLKVKPAILMPIVGALSIIGSYAIGINIFDIKVMVVCGIIGYFLTEMGYPPAPLILGTILGPMADANFRRALLTSDGSILPFFMRPVSIIFVILITWSIVSMLPIYIKLKSRLKKKRRHDNENN
ncbi:MAG: tripartite tricarboxylate transporter permease [Spirochaetia bacterium]|jgi:putative tricarboxylic transport membrane protein|nr:tripartite tricarboxylate transporter permease [Spirochaetia bacterium]